MKKIKLNLAQLSVSNKVKFGSGVSKKITGNPDLPSPNPSVSTLDTATTDLKTASDNTVGGTKEQTAIMYEAEKAWDTIMTGMAGYVEFTANQNPDKAEGIILSAGFEIKKKGVIDIPDLRVKPGPVANSALLYAKAGEGKTGYKFQKCTDPITDDGWRDCGDTQVVKLLVTDLPPLTKIWFRVAYVKGSNTLPYKDPISFVVG